MTAKPPAGLKISTNLGNWAYLLGAIQRFFKIRSKPLNLLRSAMYTINAAAAMAKTKSSTTKAEVKKLK